MNQEFSDQFEDSYILGKKSREKGNEVTVKEASDSITKYTVKGTLILKIGENEITLSGDSVDVVLKKVLKANINSENWSYNLKH